LFAYRHLHGFDLPAATVWLERSASAGNVASLWHWSQDLFKQEKHEQALSCLRMAADAGDCYARCDLGLLYLNGSHGVTKDSSVALALLEQSAAQGCVEAMRALKKGYAKGGGLPTSSRKSLKWKTAAAEAEAAD
jgi:TPR repeat protein